MFFFTSDEHYYHTNMIALAKRPYANVEEMNAGLITKFNSVVTKSDVTVHAGDFIWVASKEKADEIIKQLNGTHIFLKGNHDWWLPELHRVYWTNHLEGQRVFVSHYPMRAWLHSFHGSWNLHGHTHTLMKPEGMQLDIGVDNNNLLPFSFEQVARIMDEKSAEDNAWAQKVERGFSLEEESE